MFGHKPNDIVEVRTFSNGKAHFTQQDLDDEARFLAIKDKPLNIDTVEIQAIKHSCFKIERGFGAADLTDTEKDVLLRIGKSRTGEDILKLYIPHYNELLESYKVFPFAHDILHVRNCIENLPTILRGLVVKGAISEVLELDDKNLLGNK